jgi:hypothetical protein
MDCTANCKLFSWLISAIFLFNIAYAFNCNYFSGQLYQDCLLLKDTNPELISDLIYTDNRFPNHDFIRNYNSNIALTPIQTHNKGNIRDAWLEVPYIYPSILFEDKLYANMFQIRGGFDYNYVVPSTYINNNRRVGSVCRIDYNLDSRSSNLDIFANGNRLSGNFNNQYSISQTTNFEIRANFQVRIRERYSIWRRYCCSWGEWGCSRYCWSCRYDYTRYNTDSLTLSKSFQVHSYQKPTDPSFVFEYGYGNTYLGNLSDFDGNLKLEIEDLQYQQDSYLFSARFIQNTDFIQMYAELNQLLISRNLFLSEGLILSPSKDDCRLTYFDFFKQYSKSCDYDIEPIFVEYIQKVEASSEWDLLLKVFVFIFVNVVLYKVIRKYWWFV